jgi:cellulose synthase/poly-beta-1,6-N-acetylglucosamine synthase-like glycosyltransferase
MLVSGIFWLLLAVIWYTYAGFPLLVGLVGMWRNRQVQQQPMTPTISLIIAAYNEERHIRTRLENALALDYPPEALEIIVASDGSDDATEAIVASYAARDVHLLRLPRRGKLQALNDAVLKSTGTILVFSDAQSLLDAQALRHLARNFADPEVGGVSGSLTYRVQADSDASGRGQRLYWSYDEWLKQMESLTGSIVSTAGAVYAIRRELYPKLSDHAVTDDFVISTAVVEQGYRLVFERDARAYQNALPTADNEFKRKVRIVTQGLNGVRLRKHLCNPLRYGFYALVLFSHKVLRRLVPVFLLLVFAVSLLASAYGPWYNAAFGAQALFYALAGVGYLLRRTRVGQQKCLYIPFFYCMANAAVLIALVKYLRRDRIEYWQPQRES